MTNQLTIKINQKKTLYHAVLIESPLLTMIAEVEDEKIVEPFSHILQVPGKRVRSKLIQALNLWLKIPQDKLERIQDIVEQLHNASLLIDDVQDGSILRRGVPSAHVVYGISQTLVAANYICFDAFLKVLDLQHEDASRIYTQQSLEVLRGQGMDVYWRDSLICPTEEEYKQMCIRKTGSLFLLALKFMQLFSDVDVDLVDFATKLGLFFQIRDDYMNLVSDDYSKKKTFCEDISEGKFSFPMIHAIRTHPEDKRLIHIIEQRPSDYETKKYCVSIMKEFGSLAYTKRVLMDLKAEIDEEVKNLPNNTSMLDILDNILKLED